MSKRGWVLFALMSVIWGVPYLMIKVAVAEVSVPVLVFARTAIGAAVLLPLALRGGRMRGVRRHWPALAAFATLEIIVSWWLLSDAERHVSSSMAGLLIAASPVVAVILERISGGTERLSVKRWIGLAVGLGGVALLAGPELRGGNPWAIVEVLLTAVCYATAPLIAARHLKDVDSLPMTAVCLGGAALVYAGPAVATWPDSMPSAPVLAALAGLALVCTALAFIVFFALIREVGASRALVFTYVNPAVAVAAGVIFLSEPLTPGIVASFVLILGGSILATAPQKAGAAAPEPAARPVP
ncbi:DMT family transporter [Bailinhaonella thermotolerans]|uniref:EamA family transporter n=1 Tax=Bailinhaonella thermotolerans TaxID=1070861 RepID=A0A3A4ATP9_9ACTN|nr:EamA family transporter [Bailinhaonella thermotolerans]RJL24798.1 EamA family transporter [Bailinhaonella thermotolerans]